MTRLRVIVARLVGFLSTRRRDADLNDEIQAHLDLLTNEHMRAGLSLDDARAAGIVRLRATMQAENSASLKLMRRMTHGLTTRVVSGQLEVAGRAA